MAKHPPAEMGHGVIVGMMLEDVDGKIEFWSGVYLISGVEVKLGAIGDA